jgi:hypothetical protein
VVNDERSQDSSLGLWGGAGQAKKHHSLMGLSPTIHHFPEILVCSDESGFMEAAKGENLGVGKARVHLGDIPDRVPAGPKFGGDLPLDSFVAEEPQATSVGAG